VANIILCVIHQANYLLDQQKRQLERAFLEQGGLRERMTQARLGARARDEISLTREISFGFCWSCPQSIHSIAVPSSKHSAQPRW
jgi:four helix bundle suffix protein